MSRRQAKNRGDWGVFVATVLLIGFAAAWFLIPSKVIENAWHAESKQMEAMAGPRTEKWIKTQALTAISGVVKDAEKAARDFGGSIFERWLADRIYASVMWIGAATQRAYTLMMWMLLGIPLLLAAAVDGFYVREIRKSSFISQSPIRHKIGVHFLRLVSIVLILWLLLPIPVPTMVAPAVVCFMAFAIWLWVGNLQKRL